MLTSRTPRGRARASRATLLACCSITILLSACGGAGEEQYGAADAGTSGGNDQFAPLAASDASASASSRESPTALSRSTEESAPDKTSASPTPAPTPSPERAPAPQPAPTPEPAPAPGPSPEPVPAPVPSPTPVSEPAPAPAPVPVAANIERLNAMLYSNMPAMGKRPAVVYEHAYYPGGQQTADGRPTALGYQYAVRNALDQYLHPVVPATHDLVVIDVERWHVWPWVVGDEHRKSIEKYAEVARETRAGTNQPVCIYSIAPSAGLLHSNWSVTDPAVRDTWTTHSDITTEVLLPEVDALCPALYTYYGGTTELELDRSIEQWKVFARETIAEARRMAPDKPVYAFLWPQYHTGGTYKDFRYIEERYWRAQLELIKGLADGVVLWGGWNFTTNLQQPFDPNATWYKTYRQVFPD